ncbi:MAG: hypothetical protein FJX66_11825 [Alphaproteobacteria bacterium]|nr:hypothetical protein [Alphaproteobacteria bacterium]
MRLLATTLLALAGTLSASVGVAHAAPSDRLVAFVREKSAVIEMLQTKATRTVATAAHDPFILDYVVASRDDVREILLPKVNRQLVGIQAGLQVEEICLIAPDGREYARVVRGEVAADLSEDESGAPFFEPSWQLTGGNPYVTQVYRSPDTGEWVIGYAMPVGGPGEQDALLHLEQSLRRILLLLEARPAPNNVRWYVIEDDALTLYDSDLGAKSLSPASESADPAGRFSKPPFDRSVLIAIEQKSLQGESLGVSLEGQPHNAAARRYGRWMVLALREAGS